MKFHALICARAGSKGIKNKNITFFQNVEINDIKQDL